MNRVVLLCMVALVYACGPSNGDSDTGTGSDAASDLLEDGQNRDDLPEVAGDCLAGCGDLTPGDFRSDGSTKDTAAAAEGYQPFSIAPQQKLFAAWGKDDVLFAVGENGLVLRRQGSFWSPMQSPTGKDLYFVFGLAVDDVYAGGEDGMLLHFDGTAWTKLDTGLGPFGDITFRGAWGEGEQLYVVGDKGTILHSFEGTWKKDDSLSSYNLHAIWGVSLSDVYVAAAGGTILRKMGGAWSSQQVTQGSIILRTVYALSSKDLWGGGTKGGIVLHEASGWSPKLSNDAYERTLHGSWAFTKDDVWLVGEDGALVHNQADKWMTAEIAGPYYKNHSFFGLWGVGGETAAAWAVGEKGAILHYDGSEWKDEASAPMVDLNDIVGLGYDQVVAVGGDGLVLRFDGEKWAGADRVTASDLTSVVPFGGAFWAVGDGGAVVKVDGMGVSVIEAGLEASLLGICASNDTLVAVGEQGKMFSSGDGETWAATPTGVFEALRDCHVDDSGTATVVGDMGRLLEVKGDEVTEVAVATIANLNRIASDATGNLYVVGDNGLILRKAEGGFEKIHEEPGLFLYGLHVFADQVVAVGWAGRLLLLDPASGEVEQLVTPEPGVLLAVWGADEGHVFVVGKKGKMLRYVDEGGDE